MTDERIEHEDEAIARYRKLPKPEPSAALDAAILAQARTAAGAPVERRERNKARWPVALATAASLVLAVGVGYRLNRAEQSRQPVLESAPVPAAQDRRMPENAVPSLEQAPAASASSAAAAPPSGPAVDDLETITVAGSRIKRTDQETTPSSTADTATKTERVEAAPKPQASAPEALLEESVPAPAAPPPPPPPEPAAPVAAAAPRPFADVAQEERDDALELRKAPATEEPVDSVRELSAESPADAAGNASNVAAEPASQRAPAPRDLERKAGERSQSGLSPTHARELGRIEEMIERGRVGDAKRALARFRRAHPDVEIPREILDALE